MDIRVIRVKGGLTVRTTTFLVRDGRICQSDQTRDDSGRQGRYVSKE